MNFLRDERTSLDKQLPLDQELKEGYGFTHKLAQLRHETLVNYSLSDTAQTGGQDSVPITSYRYTSR